MQARQRDIEAAEAVKQAKAPTAQPLRMEAAVRARAAEGECMLERLVMVIDHAVFEMQIMRNGRARPMVDGIILLNMYGRVAMMMMMIMPTRPTDQLRKKMIIIVFP